MNCWTSKLLAAPADGIFRGPEQDRLSSVVTSVEFVADFTNILILMVNHGGTREELCHDKSCIESHGFLHTIIGTQQQRVCFQNV